ncbi:selenocysteine lyase, partial [Muricauda sp. TY007]|nr:selenocysteine lyase [Muricauda sp. TY007]
MKLMDSNLTINLESHFKGIKEGVVGNDTYFQSPYGTKKILYADWIATGRLYRPIEEKLMDDLGPYLANTHSYSSETGKVTSNLYMEA